MPLAPWPLPLAGGATVTSPHYNSVVDGLSNWKGHVVANGFNLVGAGAIDCASITVTGSITGAFTIPWANVTGAPAFQVAAQVTAAIVAYGYQTAAQVTTAITAYGYQTSAQVTSAITAAKPGIQTPWGQDINGGGFKLTGVGNVGIGNTAAVLPNGGTASTHLIVGPTSLGTPYGEVTLCSNTATAGGCPGLLNFANYNIAGTEKRIALIGCFAGSVPNSGNLHFYTYNAGSIVLGMRIDSVGNVGIGTASAAATLHAHCGTDLNLLIGSKSWVMAGAVGISATNDAVNVFVPMQYSASGHYFNGGNVGIGTTAATYPLDIVSASAVGARVQPATGTNPIGFYASNASGGGLLCGVDSSAGNGLASGALAYSAVLNANVNSVMHFATANSVKVTINGANMGIGTTAPRAQLAIVPPTALTTAATATSLMIGESTNLAGYNLTLGYYFDSVAAWCSVIQSRNNNNGAPLLLNPLGGGVVMSAAPGGILDSSLTNSSCYIYLYEPANQVVIRVKNSAGVIKQVALTLS